MLIRAVTAGAVLATGVALAAPASAETGVSNGATYTWAMASFDGATRDSRGHWRVQAAQLSGGERPVADVFNTASGASARRVIDAVRADAPADATWNFEAETNTTFRSIAIGQVIAGTWSAELLARLVRYVGTVVIDSRTAQPIQVVDLFSNPQAGLDRLAEQTKVLTNYDGIVATAENFANWIPTADGIELYFPSSVLFWPGSITVPWSALTDVLAPGMAGLAEG